MPTIDDVARYAGVSHGTASKVINNVPGVSSKKIELVQKAIEVLGYQPNIYARNLKSQTTKCLDLILPSIQDKATSDLYDSIYWAANADGYSVKLHISHEIPVEETAILTEILSAKTDGVLLVTCQPENETLFSTFSKKNIPLIFIQRAPSNTSYDFVRVEIKDLLYQHISEMLQQGYSDIALITLSPNYTFEADCRSAYLNAMLDHQALLRDEYIMSASHDAHTATLAAIRLLQSDTPPQVIYTTNASVAVGVHYAIRLTNVNPDKKPICISLESSSWERFPSNHRIYLSYAQAGLEAYSLLKSKKTQKITPAPLTVRIPSTAAITNVLDETSTASSQRELHFLVKPFPSTSDSALMLEASLNRLEKKQGIKVHIEYFDSDTANETLYNTILNDKTTAKYDLFTLDITMLSPLEKEGALLALDQYPSTSNLAYQNVPENILNAYGMVNNKLMALPFSFSTQLLFYRKDLFNNSKLQRLYLELYKEELSPPCTWKQYNQVAKFFTRSFNPESPTLYGSTLLGSEGVEILPRFWSQSKKRKEFTIDTLTSPAFAETVRYLLELYNYTPDFTQFPKPLTWTDPVNTFRQGDVAMMPIFADWAYDLTYSSVPELAGNLGYALLPGKYSIQGGWSVAINPHSSNKESALQVLNWLYSEELLLPNAIAGRFLPHKVLEQNAELYALFPWYKTMMNAFDYALPRPYVGKSHYTSDLPGTGFGEIMQIIHNCYLKKLPVDVALAMIQKLFE